MKKNMSSTDGIIRIIVAFTILALWYFGIIGGWILTTLVILAIIFMITGFISFCPLYSLFGWRTKK